MSDILPSRYNDKITPDPPVHAETPVPSASAATDAKRAIPPVTEAPRHPFSPCGHITLYESFSDNIAANPVTTPSGEPVANTAYSSSSGEDYIVKVHLVPVTEKSREEFRFLKAMSDAEAKRLNGENKILVAQVAVSTMVLWGFFWGGITLLKGITN